MSNGLRAVLLALSLAVIAIGCGGGGGGSFADTGIGGSGGAARGPIQGFGSIIVNDLTLNIDDAEFEIEGQPGGVGSAGQSQLSEGQVIVALADLDSGDAQSVYYRSDVRGPLVGTPVIADPLTGRGTLDVLGQTVFTNSATIYSNGAALDTLANGDEVEVSGNRDADGNLVATFIELKSGLTEFKVVGTVASVNDEAKTFRIDGLAVDYASASLDNLSGDPTSGMTVEVKLDAADFVAPGNATASSVERLDRQSFEDGTDVDFEGLITRFVSATDFDVSGQRVTTTASTTYENGSAASLGLNVEVKVEGSINSVGTLVADKVVIELTEAIRAESTVSSVNLVARTVSVDVGLTFVVRSSAELEDDVNGGSFTLDQLQAGDFVEIRGYLDGSALIAAEVSIEDFRTRFTLRAPVQSENPSAGTLSLLGVQVTGQEPTTEFQDAEGRSVTQSEFFDLVVFGTSVEARWDPFVSTGEIAEQLSIEVED